MRVLCFFTRWILQSSYLFAIFRVFIFQKRANQTYLDLEQAADARHWKWHDSPFVFRIKAKERQCDTLLCALPSVALMAARTLSTIEGCKFVELQNEALRMLS